MAPSLCENCHKRPKFGTHKYCGKTCAAQAAAAKSTKPKPSQGRPKARPTTGGRQRAPAPGPQKAAVQLCIYCGQKPKFNNFDYCGKTCAALAATAQTKPPAAQGGPGTKQKPTRIPTAPPKNVQAPPRAAKAPQAKVPVAQYDSPEEDEFSEEAEEYGDLSTDLDAYPSDPESEEEQKAPIVAAVQSVVNLASKTGRSSGPRKATTAGACAIPGCGQPCHVGSGGSANYCSMKHREEAVKEGLEEACIMCQRYPQSTSDYFCSSACRNQSMTKT